jgi:uncharacterized CHY-type Zn-finger protein
MCKHITNVQASIRAPCCKKWFDCAECHAEKMDHPLEKTWEMVSYLSSLQGLRSRLFELDSLDIFEDFHRQVFACKQCKKVFRKNMKYEIAQCLQLLRISECIVCFIQGV